MSEHVDDETETGLSPATDPSNDPGALAGAEPVRRRPGRPRKDGTPTGSPRTENVTQLFSRTAPPKKSATKKNVEPIKKMLVSIHSRAALLFDAPYLAMDDEEADMLAPASADLLEYYKIKIEGKRGAMIAFVCVVIVIYGPRLFAFVIQQKMKATAGHNGGPPLNDDAAPAE